RDQVVDVRVVADLARPGLQHAEHAKLATQEARVQGQLLQSRSRGSKQQVVHGRLVAVGDVAQFGGQGEGDQEVRDWQQQLLLPRQPGLGGVLLASRTVASAARVIAVARGR